MFRQVVLIAMVLGVLGGCRHPMVPEEASADYADGFSHGCDTGYADGGRQTHQFAARKDGDRYESSTDYAQGWDAGYEHCYDEQYRTPWIGGPDGGAML